MISVLLVHDNSDIIESTRAFLERRGDIRVDVVHSTKQALEKARSRKYDIIVSYYRIPDIDGIEFLADMTGIELQRELKAHLPAVPFILYVREGRDNLILGDINLGSQVPVPRDPSPPPVTEMRDMIYQAILRKKAERDQVLRADLLSSILSVTPLWLCQVVGGKVEWVNSTMARGLGMDPAALRGRDVSVLFSGREESDRAFREAALRVDDQGWGHAGAELRAKDGTPVPVHLRVRSMDPQDPSRGQILVVEDQTERVRLETTIREHEIRYREFLSHANSLIVKLDPEGAVTFFNAHAQAFFGYSEAEIVGKRLQDTLIPAGTRKDAPDFARDTRLVHEGRGLSITEMVLRSGEPVWVAWTLSPIRDANGRLAEVVCIGHDITDHAHRDRHRISTAAWRDTVISGTDVEDQVFDSVLHICMEIAREGREGKKLGTAFVIGDADAVLERSRQLILNPLEGHPPEERMVTNPEIKEMIKELAQLDGAFVVRGDGRIEAAARYITVDTSRAGVPKGLGTRHSSIAAITLETAAVGIVLSQSGGRISIFRNGRIVQEIS